MTSSARTTVSSAPRLTRMRPIVDVPTMPTQRRVPASAIVGKSAGALSLLRCAGSDEGSEMRQTHETARYTRRRRRRRKFGYCRGQFLNFRNELLNLHDFTSRFRNELLRLNSVFGVYRRSFLCPGGSEELFSFLRAAPSCILDLPTPFLCQAQKPFPAQASLEQEHSCFDQSCQSSKKSA